MCPACAEVYRADTYQLVLAGLNGGKGVPATIQQHPCAFPTFTAPSFGPVHSTRRTADGRRRMCRPGRTPKICPHGVDLRCFTIHGDHEKCLGTALCLDCYDYDRQVVWNVMAGELWRRTIDRAKATLRRWARNHGGSMRLSFAKVAEMQARGVAHFHALVRIDGHDPSGDDAFPIPHLAADYALLDHALTDAARNTRFRTPPHADHPEGWLIEWGREFKVLPVRMSAAGEVTETQVAGYLAKYATKSTEATGHISQRVTEETVGLYFEEDGHAARMLEACWRLGRPGSDLDPSVVERNSRLSFERLRRWAHMLGFGGHFSTKSRLYSTTLRALREARALWRQEHYRTADHMAEETTLLVGSFTFADSGWRTLGDALLANTAAAMAREHRRTVEDELQFFAQIHSQSASKQPRSE